MKGALALELGQCPISSDEGYRLIDRFLGDPKIDKKIERALELIPKFSGKKGTDAISITDFLDRISELGQYEPTLTKIYYLKSRMDGFVR